MEETKRPYFRRPDLLKPQHRKGNFKLGIENSRQEHTDRYVDDVEEFQLLLPRRRFVAKVEGTS
jgi:hypothetical protein